MKKNVLVIGAGIGGLSCAALLAHEAYKVTVFEKNSYIGGDCSSYMKKGYTLDRTLYLFTRGVNGPFGIIIKRLGLKNLDFVKEINKRTAMKIYRMEGYYPFDLNVNAMFDLMKASNAKGTEGQKGTEKISTSVVKGLKSMCFTSRTLKDLTRIMISILMMKKKKLNEILEEGLTVS